jgi:geranylgeranyl pyrophosphate synthase
MGATSEGRIGDKRMNVRERLEAMRRDVDAELARLLATGDEALSEILRYAVLGGGKRFRPLLLLSAGEAFGAGRASLLPYACAVELIHAFSLVHDDLPAMDNDDMRRGKPSTHKAFGEGPALLAGDGLLALAFETMARAPSASKCGGSKDTALGEIAAAAGVGGMILGQWLDIHLRPGQADEAAFVELVRKKTGALIRASAVSGALVAGAPADALAAMAEYGEAVGLAFQLRDDLADAGRSASPTGVNAVAFFGRAETISRLEAEVRRARAALERGKIASPELCFLAEGLAEEPAV